MHSKDDMIVVELLNVQGDTLEERNSRRSEDLQSKVSCESCQVEGVYGQVFAYTVVNKSSMNFIVEPNFEGTALSPFIVDGNSTFFDVGYTISSTHVRPYEFVKVYHEKSDESVRSPEHGVLQFKISYADHVTYSDIDVRQDPCKIQLRRRSVKRSPADKMKREPQVILSQKALQVNVLAPYRALAEFEIDDSQTTAIFKFSVVPPGEQVPMANRVPDASPPLQDAESREEAMERELKQRLQARVRRAANYAQAGSSSSAANPSQNEPGPSRTNVAQHNLDDMMLDDKDVIDLTRDTAEPESQQSDLAKVLLEMLKAEMMKKKKGKGRQY